MSANYGSESDFWEWENVLWGCTPIFTDPVKDPAPAPLGVTIINITPRYDEPRHPHIAHDGDFDPDDTQQIVIAWEGEGNDNDIQ